MTCLYEQSGGHSPKIGEANDGTPIYGMWENYETRELPLLDACGGQFGVTPDSNGEVIYHYSRVWPPHSSRSEMNRSPS